MASATATHVSHEAVSGGITSDRFEIEVPLDHFGDGAQTMKVSFRVIAGKSSSSDKYLLFLQGGPGFGSPAPWTASSGWIKAALDKKYQVVLMDQRGAGMSTPISCRSLEAIGSGPAQVAYLKQFRADSIVRDAESVRESLGIRKWSTVGQSYGGFISFTYLLASPESLEAVFLTGGVPPAIDSPMSAELVYSKTFRRVIKQNDKFYRRFPSAEPMAARLVNHVVSQESGRVVTPMGNHLTPNSIQLLGLGCLGFSGGFEKLYGLLESAFEPDGHLSFAFLKEFDASMSFDTNPLYALLHESIYCQGSVASDWAAERVRLRPEFREMFDAATCAAAGNRVMFTGEMVFPFVFDDIAELRRVKEAAELFAKESQWSALYPSASSLADNAVPIAAACYFDDMFVDFELAEETLARVPNARRYVTNEVGIQAWSTHSCALTLSLLLRARSFASICTMAFAKMVAPFSQSWST